MSALSEPARQLAGETLADLPRRVRLVFFTQTFGCETCYDQHRLLQAVAELSPSIVVEECNLVLDGARAAAYGVDRAPSIAIVALDEAGAEIDYGIRFVGLTAGYEFQSLVEGIRLVSRGETDLSPSSQTALATLTERATIQVFVTPTCAFCGSAVLLAYRIAIASPHVSAAAVEVSEFPDLIRQYRVNGVPKIVVNGRHDWLGQQTEETFVAEMVDRIATSA
ncbi:MAG: thioredoxin family protein [Vicinamibacterales bacterium]